MMFYKFFFPLCLLFSFLSGETFNTFYGPIEVEEPVLLELIKSPAMQRLKKIHQYGVAYYTSHKEEYNRYDHSMGVFALLKKNQASLEEQIAGLLHDISHTVFSHVGDWVFGKEYQEDDYQSTIYRLYLSHSGIEEILLKHGYTINSVFPKNQNFCMLEQPLPDLSADRIDYNIQGAFFQKFLSKEEALKLYNDFRFESGHWTSTQKDLLKKLAYFSLFMTEDCWGSAFNYVTSRWLADAIIRGLDLGLLSWHEIHFGIDEQVWNKLQHTKDPFIRNRMERLSQTMNYCQFCDPSEATAIVKFRCRGIDPWIFEKGAWARLTSVDQKLAKNFSEVKEKSKNGWAIRLKNLTP